MKKRQIVFPLLGVFIAGLTVQPATALTLNLVQVGSSSLPAPPTFGPELKLFEAEWRAGVHGPGDYEAALGPDGANVGLTGQFEIDWDNAQPVIWDLSYTSGSGLTQLTINGETATYNSPLAGVLKNFALIANVKPREGLVVDGTKIEINITDINNCSADAIPCDLSLTPTLAELPSQPSLAKYFTSDAAITSFEGQVIMTWDSVDPQPPGEPGARSSVAVKLKAFDPEGIDPEDTIPEPSSMLGLLAVGVMGTLSKLKTKKLK